MLVFSFTLIDINCIRIQKKEEEEKGVVVLEGIVSDHANDVYIHIVIYTYLPKSRHHSVVCEYTSMCISLANKKSGYRYI